MINTILQKILAGYLPTKEDALDLLSQNTKTLMKGANIIHQSFCKNTFELCTIVNGKNGQCSENCKFCAQSSHYSVPNTPYPLLNPNYFLEKAKESESLGILRYSIVTSGRKVTTAELEKLCESYETIQKQSTIRLCASHGLLSFEEYQKLKKSGVTRIHNNLETSRRFFPKICTTHTYDDKILAIQSAQKAGLSVCCGGIIGLGETMEDRIDMILEIRNLGIQSVPINILNPIDGTPLENISPLSISEIYQTIAIFRFLLPNGVLRLAGGRNLLPHKGKDAFLSGINAAITGNLLTTTGSTTSEDRKILHNLGFQISTF